MADLKDTQATAQAGDDESEYTDDTDPWDPDLDEMFADEGCLDQFIHMVDDHMATDNATAGKAAAAGGVTGDLATQNSLRKLLSSRKSGRRSARRSGNLSNKPSARISGGITRKLSAANSLKQSTSRKLSGLPGGLDAMGSVGTLGSVGEHGGDASSSRGLESPAGVFHTSVGSMRTGGSGDDSGSIAGTGLSGLDGNVLVSTPVMPAAAAAAALSRKTSNLLGLGSALRAKGGSTPGTGSGTAGTGSGTGGSSDKGVFKRMKTALLTNKFFARSATNMTSHPGPGTRAQGHL